MKSTTIKDDLRCFRRSWVHHTGMQLATLSVLTATLAVTGFVLMLGMNLNRVLVSLGENVQVSAYLLDGTSSQRVSELESEIKKIPGVEGIKFISRENATENFKGQIASYAPDLLSDADFANPFPASFRISFNGAIKGADDLKTLDKLAARIGALQGVEDVSYGESWVRNYASFVSTIAAGGAALLIVLLIGGLFVIGNSVRASIATRREEIEILELIGATANMIRRPYIVEGGLMGGAAALFALILNFAFHLWQMNLLSSSVALGRLAGQFSFIGFGFCVSFILGGATLGASGAFLTIRNINTGWSARHKTATQ
jgi:cell division transport system permease protein